MSEPDPARLGRALAFGSFRLFPAQQLLRDGDEQVALGSRALDILVALTERPGEIIGKEALMARVWPDTVVEENNLRVHIAGLRRALRDGQGGNRYIATIPGRGYRFVAPITLRDLPAAADPPVAFPEQPANLPYPLTRMVGRDGIVSSLCTQLRQRRFVTLVGPGGIGKTTVAAAVAREMASSYREGVRFVDLAPVSNPLLVPSALAAAFELAVASSNPLPVVIAFLKQKQILLILDNCEHVVEAAALAAEELVNGALGLCLLATSREPLRAAGERVHRLSPLESPSVSADLTAAEALEFPSVQLFVECAAARQGDFTFSDADAPIVARICRRLDGIALAIELAAGHVEAFGVRELATRLDDQFRLLMSGRRTALPRHQTLAATLQWSYELLAEPERVLLRRLGVFAGDFSIAAAIAVAPDLPSGEVVDHVADLVAKSLVAADLRADPVQYRLLDTTRLYSLQKLKNSGEFLQIARHHAEYHRAILTGAAINGEPHAKHDNQIDNLRAALEWAFSPSGSAEIGVALTIAAVPLWVRLSLMAECREWVERALAIASPEPGEQPRMQLSAALGWSHMFAVGPARDTGAAWAATLELAERLRDTNYRLQALWGLWVHQLNNGEFRKALQLATQFAELVTEVADNTDRMMADRLLATSLHFMGDQHKARHHIDLMLQREATPMRTSQVTRFQVDHRVTGRYFQARILWLQGFTDQALRIVKSNIQDAQALGHALSLASALGQGACPIALFTGDLDAAQCYGQMLLDHAELYGIRLWRNWARCFLALVGVKQGDVAAGLNSLRTGLAQAGDTIFLPRYLLLQGELAVCLGAAGEAVLALKTIDDTLARCERNEELWYIAELLRIRGELTRSLSAPDTSGVARDYFLRALGWARRQDALAWELRCAISLARLQRDDDRMAEARETLSGVYRRFSEGFETEDLRVARRLLDEMT